MEKIALILHAMDLGGAQRVASDLSLELAKKHDVTIITFETTKVYYPYGGKLISLDFEYYGGGPIRKVLSVIKLSLILRKVIKEHGFDKIYSFMEGANYPSIIADKRTIGSIHCNPDKCYEKRDWQMSRFVYPRAHAIISVSDDITKLMREKIKLKNVVTVYNPIDFERIQKAAQEPIDIEKDFIIAVGRLVSQKNYELLIDAFALSKAKEHLQLLIVGEGPLQEAIEKRIKKHKLESNVTLVGYSDNPFKYIAKSRFMVASSDTEAFPMSLIEALCLGIPVISTDCPTGPREIITHNENGLLTEVGNATELSEAIDLMQYDIELREQISNKAASSVTHLKSDHIANEMLDLYK